MTIDSRKTRVHRYSEHFTYSVIQFLESSTLRECQATQYLLGGHVRPAQGFQHSLETGHPPTHWRDLQSRSLVKNAMGKQTRPATSPDGPPRIANVYVHINPAETICPRCLY